MNDQCDHTLKWWLDHELETVVGCDTCGAMFRATRPNPASGPVEIIGGLARMYYGSHRNREGFADHLIAELERNGWDIVART